MLISSSDIAYQLIEFVIEYKLKVEDLGVTSMWLSNYSIAIISLSLSLDSALAKSLE